MKKLLFILTVFSVLQGSAQKVKNRVVDYKDGDQQLEGYVADGSGGKIAPLIIVVHEWKGVNDYVKKRCEQLAALGYIAFAADVYGKGIRPESNADAAKEATKYKTDRALTRKRMNAALDFGKKLDNVDPTRIAVIGYCFGGMAALELGRSGADIKGIVSFHGTLANPTPSDASRIKAKVLICHGAVDPNVPEKEVQGFKDEMDKAEIDYQFISYSKAVHAFTNPASGKDPSKGAAYNKEADLRSWNHMIGFFKEVLK